MFLRTACKRDTRLLELSREQKKSNRLMKILPLFGFHADIPESLPNVTHEKGLMGSRLTLRCPLNDSNASISWHNTDWLEIDEASGIIWDIDSVDFSHAGRYACVSMNTLLARAGSRFATAHAEFVIHVFNSKFLVCAATFTCETIVFVTRSKSSTNRKEINRSVFPTNDFASRDAISSIWTQVECLDDFFE